MILGFAIAAVPGGLPVIWQLAAADGKTGLWRTQLDPTVRITIWSGLLGGISHDLVMMVTDQISVQRYLTAPSLRDSQRALWLKLWVTFPLVALFYLSGTVLYGYYKAFPNKCPRSRRPGWFQAWPHLHHLRPGREFLTTVCCLILSSIIFRARCLDFSLPAFVALRWPWCRQPSTRWRRRLCWIFGRSPISDVSDRSSLRRARILTIFFGFLGTLLALVVMKHLGTLVQAVNTIFSLWWTPTGYLRSGCFVTTCQHGRRARGCAGGRARGNSGCILWTLVWLWNLIHVDLVLVCGHDATRRLAGKFSLLLLLMRPHRIWFIV